MQGSVPERSKLNPVVWQDVSGDIGQGKRKLQTPLCQRTKDQSTNNKAIHRKQTSVNVVLMIEKQRVSGP